MKYFYLVMKFLSSFSLLAITFLVIGVESRCCQTHHKCGRKEKETTDPPFHYTCEFKFIYYLTFFIIQINCLINFSEFLIMHIPSSYINYQLKYHFTVYCGE